MNCKNNSLTNETVICNMTLTTVGRIVNVSIDFGDSKGQISWETGDSSINLYRNYTKSGMFNIIAAVNPENITSSNLIAVNAHVIFELRCPISCQVGELIKCYIKDVLSNANVQVTVYFGDGEERLLYLGNDDIQIEKIFSFSGLFTVTAISIDTNLAKFTQTKSILVSGSNLH